MGAIHIIDIYKKQRVSLINSHIDYSVHKKAVYLDRFIIFDH